MDVDKNFASGHNVHFTCTFVLWGKRNSYSTLANHHHWYGCLTPPSFLTKEKENSFAAPVADSQVGWQQLQWVDSVYNAPHLIVANGNGVVMMEIVIN